MTEKEIMLMDELEKEKSQKELIENAISKKQTKLKECKQRIIDLELAVKEEQLNSIRDSIDKNGFDFFAFREALEKGRLNSFISDASRESDIEIKNEGEKII